VASCRLPTGSLQRANADTSIRLSMSRSVRRASRSNATQTRRCFRSDFDIKEEPSFKPRASGKPPGRQEPERLALLRTDTGLQPGVTSCDRQRGEPTPAGRLVRCRQAPRRARLGILVNVPDSSRGNYYYPGAECSRGPQTEERLLDESPAARAATLSAWSHRHGRRTARRGGDDSKLI